MKLSTKVRYGVRAMVDLALHSNGKPVLVQSIAERQEISRKYLENLLVSLKTAGIVRSLRGARGGYVLARPAEDITMEELVIALEGPPTLIDCLEDPAACHRVDFCATRDLWKEMTLSLRSLLKRTTLADLADRAKEKIDAAGSMYYI